MDNFSTIRQGLLQRGLPEHVADGFMMNFQDESGLDPGIVEHTPNVHGTRGFGLYQLTGPRRTAYEAFAMNRGVPAADIDAQLDWMMHELQGTEASAGKAIMATENAGQAADAIVRKFLRPAAQHRESRSARYLGGNYTPQTAGNFNPAASAQESEVSMNQGGLLGMLQGNPQSADAPTADGLLGMLFPNMSADRADTIRLGLMGTDMNPNYGAMNAVAGRMANRADDKRYNQIQARKQAELASQEAKELQRRNLTADWLEQQGMSKEAEAVRMGILSGGDAARGAFETQAQYSQITGEEAAERGLDPNKAYNVGPDGKITGIGAASTIINMPGNEVGTIPQGFELLTDSETGARSMRPIPGGPEDTSQNQAEVESAQETSSDVVMNAFRRALEADSDRLVGGIAGQVATLNPSSQNAELQRQVSVLQNVTSAESLNAMRRQSPTGGALGNVTERELELLARQGGALDPASPNFQRDLLDYTQALLRTIHGKDAGDEVFYSVVPQGPATPDFEAMSDEELDAWIEQNGR